MRIQLSAAVVLAVSIFIANSSLALDQKILFCYETGRYASNTPKEICESACEETSHCGGLNSLLSEGWAITSQTSKEVIAIDWKSERRFGIPFNQGCSCIGTQYVLRKEDKSTSANTEASVKEMDLLKKENELLKKENDLLKNENKSLREENDKLKAKLKKQKPKPPKED